MATDSLDREVLLDAITGTPPIDSGQGLSSVQWCNSPKGGAPICTLAPMVDF
jgi:hypothetical protein